MEELAGDRPAGLGIDSAVDPSGAPIVTLSGELDIANSWAVEATIRSIAAQHPERLVFDLSGLQFIDSAGIAVLIHATQAVPAVHLRKPSPMTRRVIELTGLTTLLRIDP